MKVTSIAVAELRLEGSNVRSLYTTEGLKNLKASILRDGVCVPLIVKRSEGFYAVLDGGRRLSAALECGMERLPCVVVDGAGGREAALAWVANFEREAVPFWEEASFFARVVGDGGRSVEELSVLLGKSVGYVRSRLVVLEWPSSLVSYCHSAGVSYSVAREFARLGDSVELERALDWDRINQPSYRQAVAYVDEILRAREMVVPSEAAAVTGVVAVPVCDVCRGERDYRTSRTLMVCASCVAAISESHLVENSIGEKPEAEGRPRRGGGGRKGATGGKADEVVDEAAPGADTPSAAP